MTTRHHMSPMDYVHILRAMSHADRDRLQQWLDARCPRGRQLRLCNHILRAVGAGYPLVDVLAEHEEED